MANSVDPDQTIEICYRSTLSFFLFLYILPVVMGVTLAPAIFKPEKNLVFFQDKIAGAIDDYPSRLE